MGAIKVLRGMLGLVLLVALGLSVWLTVQRQVLGQDPSVLGVSLRPVEESSMAPALQPGDLAVVLPQESYQMGDPLLCGDGQFRRAVGTVDGSFIARGDSQGQEAEVLLSPQDVTGKVMASLPGAGGALGFFSSYWGPVALVLVGGLLLALPSLLGLGREPDDFRANPPKENARQSTPSGGGYRPRH